MIAHLRQDFPGLPKAAHRLLAEAGLDGAYRIQRLTGGANNRVFRVDGEEGSALLKAYFQHPNDPRDRLGAEFAFAGFAWRNGVRCLPQPLACDSRHGLGLYEFVPGRPLRWGEPLGNAITQALDFLQALNHLKHLPQARKLPRASEACFSLEEHLACVDRRVQALSHAVSDAAADREAAQLVRGGLVPAWRAAAAWALRRSADLGLGVTDEISLGDRCLSPSDFGFHNAFRGDDGRLRFIDFEYAGWDDPAKVICDFFSQPTVPVPLSEYDRFARSVVAGLSDPDSHLQRTEVLRPVYRLKWCCILLNEFLPTGAKRRRFALAEDLLEHKTDQLHKASKALSQVDIP